MEVGIARVANVAILAIGSQAAGAAWSATPDAVKALRTVAVAPRAGVCVMGATGPGRGHRSIVVSISAAIISAAIVSAVVAAIIPATRHPAGQRKR